MLLFCAKTIMKESHNLEPVRWRFFMPLGVLLVMKTLEDEWYNVIKVYNFTILYYHILRVY